MNYALLDDTLISRSQRTAAARHQARAIHDNISRLYAPQQVDVADSERISLMRMPS